MANTKSAAKNARKSERRAMCNRAARSRLHTLRKKIASLQAAGKLEEARSVARELSSALDKAVQSHVIHRNAAARHKSRISGLVFGKKA